MVDFDLSSKLNSYSKAHVDMANLEALVRSLIAKYSPRIERAAAVNGQCTGRHSMVIL